MLKYDKNLNPVWINKTLNNIKSKTTKKFLNKIRSEEGISLIDVDKFIKERNKSLNLQQT